MEKLVVRTFYGEEEVTVSTGLYNDGTIAIELWCEEGPFADLTTCLDLFKTKADKQGATRLGLGVVDINNCPWAPEFIKEYELGTNTGLVKQSGYVVYPIWAFDLEKIKELSMN